MYNHNIKRPLNKELTMISERNQARLIAIAKAAIAKKDLSSYNGRTSDPSIKAGVCSMFFKITESFGVKIHKHESDVIRGLCERQKQAWALGLAPFCFGCFVAEDSEGATIIFYITEVVVIHRDVFGSYNAYAMAEDIQIKKMRRLFEQKIGFEFTDCHNNNIGLRGRRWLLCIDFGDE